MAIKNVKINSDVELKDRLVAINRVTKVTKGGRTFTFAAIVVVGDGKGVIGYGLGKAGEVTAAIAKGVEAAKKNLVQVPVIKGTARIAPPATTPVPVEAGMMRTSAPPNLAACS